MIRQPAPPRIDAKRRATFDPKRQQFAGAAGHGAGLNGGGGGGGGDYPHRLNFYLTPPTAEITLEQFEQWAIDRLRVLAELESCAFRNKTGSETQAHMKAVLDKYLPLSSNQAGGGPSTQGRAERQKDHYSHFILRLAFSRTAELRQRFARAEASLFRLRFALDDGRDRAAFVAGLRLGWEPVGPEEMRARAPELLAATPGLRRLEGGEDGGGGWVKVGWERVPDLVEGRRVWLCAGEAYVPAREQTSLVVAEFTARLEAGLELTARAVPRLDEDDRLTPILNHLSKNFATPSAFFDGDHNNEAAALVASLGGAPLTARSIDSLSRAHFPLCMQHLHRTLRATGHLKHFGRLQYTLFLKGIGLGLDECLAFWRAAFRHLAADRFDKEYRYNVRHAYGDVGGDANRRAAGARPFACQKILTEHPPAPADAHGCPYRHLAPEPLQALLRDAAAVTDRDTLAAVRDDVAKKRFHIACNRVFDYTHRVELRRARDDDGPRALAPGPPPALDLAETIVHPNQYFRRSVLLAARTAAADAVGAVGAADAPPGGAAEG